MTGYTVHTGSSRKFSQGWDQIFQSKTAAKTAKSASKKVAVVIPQPTKSSKKSK
jgi:hypothetical protein